MAKTWWKLKLLFLIIILSQISINHFIGKVDKFGGHNLNGFEVIQLFSEGGGEGLNIYLFIYFISNIDKPLKKVGVYWFFQVIGFSYWFSVDTTITKREWAAATQ